MNGAYQAAAAAAADTRATCLWNGFNHVPHATAHHSHAAPAAHHTAHPGGHMKTLQPKSFAGWNAHVPAANYAVHQNAHYGHAAMGGASHAHAAPQVTYPNPAAQHRERQFMGEFPKAPGTAGRGAPAVNQFLHPKGYGRGAQGLGSLHDFSQMPANLQLKMMEGIISNPKTATVAAFNENTNNAAKNRIDRDRETLQLAMLLQSMAANGFYVVKRQPSGPGIRNPENVRAISAAMKAAYTNPHKGKNSQSPRGRRGSKQAGVRKGSRGSSGGPNPQALLSPIPVAVHSGEDASAKESHRDATSPKLPPGLSLKFNSGEKDGKKPPPKDIVNFLKGLKKFILSLNIEGDWRNSDFAEECQRIMASFGANKLWALVATGLSLKSTEELTCTEALTEMTKFRANHTGAWQACLDRLNRAMGFRMDQSKTKQTPQRVQGDKRVLIRYEELCGAESRARGHPLPTKPPVKQDTKGFGGPPKKS